MMSTVVYIVYIAFSFFPDGYPLGISAKYFQYGFFSWKRKKENTAEMLDLRS